MSQTNYNKLLANSDNENENENFLKNVEKSSNYLISNTFHIDDNLTDKSVRVTKPSLIMFNAIVNQSFSKSEKKLELGAIADDIVTSKLPFKKYVFPNNGIGIQVKKITGRYGRLQPAFTITETYSHTGKNIFNKRVFALEFIVAVSLGSEVVHATMTIFSNGKIKLSGGYLNQRADNMNNEEFFEAQPELIREYIVNNYTNKEKFLRNNFVFNNVVSEIRFNKGFNLNVIAKNTLSNKNLTVKYEPEISPNLFIKYGGFDYVLSTRGVIKIQGIKEHDDIQESYENIIQFVNSMIEYEKSQTPNAKGRITRALLTLKLSNYRIKKQSAFNANKPAPEVTRRGTSCPMSRRPTPYSMQGKCSKEGCYVKPNPQGQPCCYKIPKSTVYSEQKVTNSYKKANVKVPNTVRRIFKIGKNTNSKRNNTSYSKLNNITVKMNSNSGLKIGSRQCMRYSKVALVDIAHRLGLPVTPGMDKVKLCNLIQSVAKNVTNTNNAKGSRAVKFTNSNKVYVVTGNSANSLKISGRFAKTIKREKLVAYAAKLGARPRDFSTIADLCKMIYERLQVLRPQEKAKTPSPSPSPSPSPNVQAMALKLRFSKNLIEEDIKKFLGPKWIEAFKVTNKAISEKAQEVYKNLGNAIASNKVNLVPANIKEFKKVLLRKWKSNYEMNTRKSKYPDPIVQRFATTKKNNGKLPTHKEVLEYANAMARIGNRPKLVRPRNTNSEVL